MGPLAQRRFSDALPCDLSRLPSTGAIGAAQRSGTRCHAADVGWRGALFSISAMRARIDAGNTLGLDAVGLGCCDAGNGSLDGDRQSRWLPYKLSLRPVWS